MSDRGYLDEPIEIAPGEFKEFRDCTTAEGDAAVALILQGRIDQLVAEELAAGQARRHKPPTCEHGDWTFAWGRLQAQGDEVALPHRQMHARFAVDQGRPAAPTDPAPHDTVKQALP